MSETIIVPKAITVALEAYRQAVHRKAVAMMTPGSDAGRADAQRAVEFAYSDVIYAMRVALAAPAEGPERAATGETLVRCGRCGVPFPPHPDPARFDHDFCEECLPEAVKHWGMMHTAPERLAAIGGGGE